MVSHPLTVLKKNKDWKEYISECSSNNQLYRYADINRLLSLETERNKNELIRNLSSGINLTYSPVTVIDEGYISKNGGYNAPGVLIPASSKKIKHYLQYFNRSGSISDLCIDDSLGTVGLLISSKRLIDYDVQYTDSKGSASARGITAFIDIAPYSKVCLHENIKHHEHTRIYKLVYIIREGAEVSIKRYYTGQDKNAATHIVESEIIQHPASKLFVSYLSEGSFYTQEVFNITAYRDTSTNVKLRYNLSEGVSTHVVTNINHIGPNGFSDIDVKSASSDSSKFSFIGDIKVDKNADNVDAKLYNKNLSIDDSVSIISEPRLNINNKNIACRHGCTTSFINPSDVYFLNCRGINNNDAKSIISKAFLDV